MGLALVRSTRSSLGIVDVVAVEPEIIDLCTIRRPQIAGECAVVEIQIVVGDTHDLPYR